MLKKLAFPVLALALAVAGCVQFEAADLDPADAVEGHTHDSPLDPFLHLDDHDHTNVSHHKYALNATQLHFDPVAPGETVEVGELDVQNGVLVQALIRPDAGLVVYDVSDPAKPVRHGVWKTQEGYGADVKLSPDGTLAFLSVQPTATDQLPVNPSLPGYGSLNAGNPGGIYVIDVSDPDNPTQVDFMPVQPRGVHMAYLHEIDGSLHLFAVHNRVGISIFQVGDDGSLTPVSTYQVDEQTRLANAQDLGLFPGAHDVTVQDTPDGRVLMNVPYGYEGLHLVDVTDPANPERLGVWFPEDGNTYYVHTAMTEWRDGKQYTYAVPEVFGEGQASLVAPLWVVDSTDPANMKQVGEWTNPGGHGADNMRFSTHNFQWVHHYVYMAHYHGGVWKIDVHDPANPTVAGYFMPHEAREMVPTGYFDGVYNLGDVPAVWDVVVHNGYVYASDMTSGLYVVAFDGDPLGDEHHSGFA